MTGLLRGRALTVADIEDMPDDGQRYELVDGVLVVSPPPPEWRHGDVALGLAVLLRAAVPSDLKALMAPSPVIIDEHTWVEPDVFVTRRSALGERWVEGPPLLAVEILSPSNQLYDLTTKFARYERAGVPSYWAIDPQHLTMVVWELRGGRYVEIADLRPDDEWTATRPFSVTVRPRNLAG